MVKIKKLFILYHIYGDEMAGLLDFPMERVEEGSANVFIPSQKKISKKLPVFYNPVMRFSRDIAILLLSQFPAMSLCDLLAGTGIRSIRFAKELNHKSIAINDMNRNSFILIKKNLRLNGIKNFSTIKAGKTKINNEKIQLYNEDANLFLLNSKGFDYIDIDPFGTSNPFLDAAIKRTARNGILAVTNTDTAALTGTYPEACRRKYWAVPKKDYMMHETGLRILIRKVQLVGMQYEKALNPIFSYYRDHYFRVFFSCIKGKIGCDNIAKQHGAFNDAGPMWLGSLWDRNLTNKMHLSTIKSPEKDEKYANKVFYDNELLKFVKIVKDESSIDVTGFYDMHASAKGKGFEKMFKKEELVRKIRDKGYKAAPTHFSGTGIRTDIGYREFLKLLKK